MVISFLLSKLVKNLNFHTMSYTYLKSPIYDCPDNHKNQYFDPSIDSYICTTCKAEFPANSFSDQTEEIESYDNEYENYIGI